MLGAAARGSGARGGRAASPAWRGAALLPAAALGVHQARYWLAYGGRARDELAAQGHAYLTGLAPWIALLAAMSVGASLGRLARRWAAGGGVGDRAPRRALLATWLLAAGALAAIYVGQELLEGLLATGHPGGIAGVLGDGGWWALPAALLAGGLLALALRVERLAEELAAGARIVRLGAAAGRAPPAAAALARA